MFVHLASPAECYSVYLSRLMLDIFHQIKRLDILVF